MELKQNSVEIAHLRGALSDSGNFLLCFMGLQIPQLDSSFVNWCFNVLYE